MGPRNNYRNTSLSRVKLSRREPKRTRTISLLRLRLAGLTQKTGRTRPMKMLVIGYLIRMFTKALTFLECRSLQSRWTESQLKAFCDRNGIPVPQPRTRDSLLKTARENYQVAANKLSETAAYPGNWLWQNWSDSELKAWCDERGIPIPQNGKRDQLIDTVRRNSRIASTNLSAWSSSLSASAAAATQYVADSVFDTWSDSQIKKWADEKGIQVPQGSKRNELLALVRHRNAQYSAEASRLSASAVSAYGAATSSAGNEFAKATEDAALKYGYAQNVLYSYIDWFTSQIGLASATASASGSSATHQVYKSASSVSKSASSAYSSSSKKAEKSYKSATSKVKAEL